MAVPERDLSTSELIRHALEEAKLLARAEVSHARLELREELRGARNAGIALGVAATLGLCGLSLLFVAVAAAFPMELWGATLIVAGVVLTIAGIAAAIGARRLPKKPLERTRTRLLDDLQVTRERLA
ncbi:MAG: phage holin family protein [Myxococcaceae bacterium]